MHLTRIFAVFLEDRLIFVASYSHSHWASGFAVSSEGPSQLFSFRLQPTCFGYCMRISFVTTRPFSVESNLVCKRQSSAATVESLQVYLFLHVKLFFT